MNDEFQCKKYGRFSWTAPRVKLDNMGNPLDEHGKPIEIDPNEEVHRLTQELMFNRVEQGKAIGYSEAMKIVLARPANAELKKAFAFFRDYGQVRYER